MSKSKQIDEGLNEEEGFWKQAEKFPGHPRLAAFMDSRIDAAIFQRFGILEMPNLLDLEAELMELDRELCVLDEGLHGPCEISGHGWKLSKGFDNPRRKILMEACRKKMEEYDLLLLYARLRRLPRPSAAIHRRFVGDDCHSRVENQHLEKESIACYPEKDESTKQLGSDQNWHDGFMDRMLNGSMRYCRAGDRSRLIGCKSGHENAAGNPKMARNKDSTSEHYPGLVERRIRYREKEFLRDSNRADIHRKSSPDITNRHPEVLLVLTEVIIALATSALLLFPMEFLFLFNQARTGSGLTYLGTWFALGLNLSVTQQVVRARPEAFDSLRNKVSSMSQSIFLHENFASSCITMKTLLGVLSHWE